MNQEYRDNEEPPGHFPPRNNAEQPVLAAMFSAAGDEEWDAAPGFEVRLQERLRSEIGTAARDLSGLLWKAVPVAAGVAILAVAASALTGSFSNLETYVISSIADPVEVEDLITLGLF
jgi:hypothetical protein